MNRLEAVRIKIGASVPQMLHLLGVQVTRRGLFTLDDDDLGSRVVARADELSALYDEWRQEVEAKVNASTRHLTSFEVARILGLSEFYLQQLLARGVIEDSYQENRQHFFTHKNVKDLIRKNSLRNNHQEKFLKRGPLTEPFLRWVRERQAVPA